MYKNKLTNLLGIKLTLISMALLLGAGKGLCGGGKNKKRGSKKAKLAAQKLAKRIEDLEAKLIAAKKSDKKKTEELEEALRVLRNAGVDAPSRP